MSELHFITPAFFPDEAGLCEAQFVQVLFSSPPNAMLRDPPVRVTNMRTSRVLILRDPDAVGRTWDRQSRDREAAACAGIDPRGRRLITNAFAHEAGLLLRWTADFLAAARAGHSPDIPLVCDLPAGVGPADCLRTLGEMRIEAVNHVARCDDGTFPRILCYTVSDGFHQLDWELGAGDSVRPVRVSYTFIITT